ncbi:MAG: amidohydrolase [Peptoniphilaceae bacterium]
MNIKLEKIKEIVENRKKDYENLANFLWENPETGLEEYKSSSEIINLLSSNGFSVEKNIDQIETAFIASYGSGKPVIGLSCEYDALPGLSQDNRETTRKPLIENGPGHGCGHNLLGSGVVGAALVIKDYVTENNIDCTIKLIGTPSEERDACKAFLGRDGYFDDLDFALTWHPAAYNGIWDGGSLANTIVIFNFKGTPSHAAAAPELGRSALDSAELMNIGVNYLREHINSDARVHYAYLDAGGKAPNVVQPKASLYYFIRSPKIKDSEAIYKRIVNIAKGAALMMDTELDIDLQVMFADYLPNRIISNVLYESIKEYGLPKFTEEEKLLAKKYFDSLDEEARDNGIKKLKKIFKDKSFKEISENYLIEDIKTYNMEMGETQSISSDVGELSHYTPTGQMFLTTASIGTPLHSWQMTAQANTSIGYKGLETAVGSLALSALKLILQPELIEKAKEELKEEIGDYSSPLPKEIKLRNPKLVK